MKRVVEHSVDKIDSKIIAQDDFLEKAVKDPKHSHSELSAREEIRLIELRDELVGTNYWSCHQLREEGCVEAKIEKVLNMMYAILIDINYIADVLKGEERDADRNHSCIETRR